MVVPPDCGKTAYRKKQVRKSFQLSVSKQTRNPPKVATDTKPTSEHPLYGGRSEQQVWI